jgi:membrane fusion protein, multidrug efflux system
MTSPIDVPAPRERPRKRAIALMVFLVILVLAGIAGVIYWRHARQFEETDDAFVDGNIVAVSPQVGGRIGKVHVKDNQDVTAGEVLAEMDPTDYQTRVQQQQAALEAAQRRADAAAANLELVKAQAAASVAQAQAGVEASQGVIQQAQAGIARAQAGLEQAQATVRWAQAQAQSTQADVTAAQAEATRREADLKRYELLDPRATSQQIRDAAKAAADAAAAQLAAAQKRQAAADAQVAQEESKVAAAKAEGAQAQSALAQSRSREAEAHGVLQTAQTGPQQVAAAQAQVKTAQAAVAQAQVDLQWAQQQLAYTKVYAPVSGRVTRKAVQLGQVVEAGRILLSLVEPDVWVTANFKETQITRMHTGQPVEVRVDAYPGRVFAARIESIQAGTGARFSLMPPENATGNYVKVVQRVPVKIVFDNRGAGGAAAQQMLGPGMSAVPRVRIAGNEGTPAPIRPAATGPAVADIDAKK